MVSTSHQLSAALAGGFGDAVWIGENPQSAFEDRSAGLLGERCAEVLPKDCPRFRRIFALPAKTVKSAEICVCGLGFYELWLNGAKADPRRILAPGWSDPHHRVLFDVYEVKPLVKSGVENAIGLWLAPGYSDDAFSWAWRWIRPKRAIAALTVVFEDGTSTKVVTDGRWEWTDLQPIRFASIYNGETYAAALADPRWAMSAGSIATWKPVAVLADAGLRLEPNVGAPVCLGEPAEPVSVRKVPSGWLFDYGDNRAGVVRMRVKASKGGEIRLRHAEELLPSADDLDMHTHRRALQLDTYIAVGGAEPETWCPRFTYHGFRYLLVSGIGESQAKLENFQRLTVSADVRETAGFESSDAVLNWLWAAAKRSMRSNFVSYPTDCCQRDERTPCLMDSRVYEDTACQAFDMRAFYTKWIGDAVVYHEGVSPRAGNNFNPDWSGDAITVAERLLRYYAATDAVASEYPRLKRLALDFAARCPGRIWRKGFGDWCPPDDGSGKDTRFSSVALVNTACLADDFRAMSVIAAALGERADAQEFSALAEETRRAFVEEFRHPDGTWGDGKQVDYVLPLAFGLIAEADVPGAVAALEKRIHGADCGHIGTGIYGTRYFGDVMLEHGLGGLWLEMMCRSDHPGFGYMIGSGATSLWERWERDGGMNSHNHAMMSGAASCLITHLGGIRPLADGYASILIAPVFVKGLDRVQCSLETRSGKVSVSWKRIAAGIALDVTVPPGAPALLRLTGREDAPLSSGAHHLEL